MQIIRKTVGIKISKNFNTIHSEEVLEFSKDETLVDVQKAKEEAYDRCLKDCQEQYEKLI